MRPFHIYLLVQASHPLHQASHTYIPFLLPPRKCKTRIAGVLDPQPHYITAMIDAFLQLLIDHKTFENTLFASQLPWQSLAAPLVPTRRRSIETDLIERERETDNPPPSLPPSLTRPDIRPSLIPLYVSTNKHHPPLSGCHTGGHQRLFFSSQSRHQSIFQ